MRGEGWWKWGGVRCSVRKPRLSTDRVTLQGPVSDVLVALQRAKIKFDSLQRSGCMKFSDESCESECVCVCLHKKQCRLDY